MRERLIADQRDLLTLDRAHPRAGQGDFATSEDHVAFIMAPARGLPLGLVLVSFARQVLDFLVDQRLHHQQTRLAGRLLNRPGHLRQQGTQRQHHLEGCFPFPHVHPHRLILEVLHLSSGTTRLSLVAFAHHAVLSYE